MSAGSRWSRRSSRSCGQGCRVIVEAGAGLGALIPDEQYTDAGATIGDPWSAEVVVKVAPPTADEIGRLGRDRC